MAHLVRCIAMRQPCADRDKRLATSLC